MDAKITKQRLGLMLSYDWIKIIFAAIAGIVAWALIFTMTATKLTSSQRFTIFNYTGNVSFSQNFYDEYDALKAKGVFSYEIMELNVGDMTIDDRYGSQILETRMATGEGNAIFVGDELNKKAAYQENGETKYKSYVDSFVLGWDNYILDLDPESETGFFKRMEAYLDGFYDKGYANKESVLDKAKVEREFRARVKKNKDKRFKTEKQIQKGITQEEARIDKYRTALLKFNDYLAKGYITLEKMTCSSAYEPENVVEKFAINLCPNEETMGSLRNTVCYRKTYKDENGKEQYKYTAENMRIFFFDLAGMDKDFEYENLLYVVHLVDTHCTELKKA